MGSGDALNPRMYLGLDILSPGMHLDFSSLSAHCLKIGEVINVKVRKDT